jgi:parallel beta-helix repeat protein
MSVLTSVSSVSYTLSSAAQALAVPFYFLDNAHVVVTNLDTDATLVLGTDYTITGAPVSPVVTTIPTVGNGIVIGTDILIQRIVPATQLVSYVENDRFPAKVHERALDKLTMIAQQQADEIAHTLRIPSTETPLSELAVVDRAGRLIGFDSVGAPTFYEPSTEVLPNSTPIQFSTSALAKAQSYADIAHGKQVSISTNATENDGGGGLFAVDKLDTTTADNVGTVKVAADGTRLKRIYSGPIHLRWFAAGAGSDETAAIQAAATLAAGGTLYVQAASSFYSVSSAITLNDNTLVHGDGAASVIQISNGGISAFQATSKTGITVRDLHIKSVNAGVTSEVAGVKLTTCTKCVVENCIFTGMSWSGVFLNGTSNSFVLNNIFNTILGTLADSNDVAVYRNSNANLIQGNGCYGAGYHGILMQNPDVGVFDVCVDNIINENSIAGQSAYGIVAYTSTQPYNTRTIISNNTIRTIYGSQLTGASGSGIYVAQFGGTTISGNNVSDCCKSTTNFGTLAPACIGVASVSGSWPIILQGNTLYSTRGPCIACISNEAKLVINGNSLYLSNSTASTNSKSIYLVNTSYARISSNAIEHISTEYYAIECVALNAYTCAGLSFSDNTVIASKYGAIFAVDGSGSYTDLNLSGNYFKNTTDTGIRINVCTGARLSDNFFSADVMALSMNNVTKARMTGNRLVSSSGSAAAEFNNTMTEGVADASNLFDLRIGNFGTGFIIQQYGSAIPSGSDTRAIGDQVIQSVPVAGNPKGWRCTVAGSPGTWVSEGNL